MSLSILTNVPAMLARRNLENTQAELGRSVGRLSSGLRINRAGDDAAGLGISENLKADIRSIQQAKRNSLDAISLSQMAEGAMNEIQGIVARMRELAIQSANGTLGTQERSYIETEFDQLRKEIDRIGAVTEYNGQFLLNGSASAGLTMQVGINGTANDRLSLQIGQIAASTLGVTGGAKINTAVLSTAAGALSALAVFDAAIDALSTARASIGAVQNRVQVTIDQLTVAHENLTGANSRIRDVDVASESTLLSQNEILLQAGIAILGQANKLPSAALALLSR